MVPEREKNHLTQIKHIIERHDFVSFFHFLYEKRGDGRLEIDRYFILVTIPKRFSFKTGLQVKLGPTENIYPHTSPKTCLKPELSQKTAFKALAHAAK